MIRCSGGPSNTAIGLALQEDRSRIIVYKDLITLGEQTTGDEIYKWIVKNKDDSRTKVMVLKQDHVYIIAWKGDELLEVFFSPEETRYPKNRRLAHKLCKRIASAHPPTHRHLMLIQKSPTGTCACEQQLCDTLRFLEGQTRLVGIPDSASLSKVGELLQQGLVPRPRL